MADQNLTGQTLQAMPRSGDVVLNSMSKVGLIVTLLSPFIAASLTWVESHTNIVLGPGYQSQLETAAGLFFVWLVGTLHMRSIRQTTAEPTVPGPDLQTRVSTDAKSDEQKVVVVEQHPPVGHVPTSGEIV